MIQLIKNYTLCMILKTDLNHDNDLIRVML